MKTTYSVPIDSSQVHLELISQNLALGHLKERCFR